MQRHIKTRKNVHKRKCANAFTRIQKYTNSRIIGSGHIGIYMDVINTYRISYGMNSGGICYEEFT